MVSRRKSGYVPRRGHVVWIDFDPQAGHEQAGRRPAVVLSPTPYNRPTELALLCPLTSRRKGYPYEVAVPEGLPVSGVILADQVKNLAWKQRRAEFICDLPPESLEDVLDKLATLLDSGEDEDERAGGPQDSG